MAIHKRLSSGLACEKPRLEFCLELWFDPLAKSSLLSSLAPVVAAETVATPPANSLLTLGS